MVPRAGLEPARPFGLGILSPLCLPFHHRGNYVFAGVLRPSTAATQTLHGSEK